jgi:hypothetical protein
MAERLPYSRRDFRTNEEYLTRWLVDMGFASPFGLGLIEGNLGGGKSLFGYTIMWWLKKLFGFPITLDQMPRPAFGSYKYFDVPSDILKEKELIDKIAERSDEWEGPEVDQLKLYKCRAFFDEFYKIAHNRRGMSNLIIEFGDIVKQSRHANTFILCAMPHKNEVDVKAIDSYVTVDIRAAWSMIKPDTANYIVYNRASLVESVFTIFGPNYYSLYNSQNPIRSRKNIDAKEYKKWQKKLSGIGTEEEEKTERKSYANRR